MNPVDADIVALQADLDKLKADRAAEEAVVVQGPTYIDTVVWPANGYRWGMRLK